MSFQSIVPPEALELQTEPPKLEYRPCRYGQLAGHSDATGHFVVSQMISTDPTAYLDDRYAPGALLPPVPTEPPTAVL
ncbi:MAG: YlzJ-like family protein [Angelakisella sp.]